MKAACNSETNMSNFRHSLAFAFLLVPQVALADGENTGQAGSAGMNTSGKESSNFGKTDRFLAGEEVITPTGKKVKVWSTEGPVPVSKAPQPFQDEVDQRLPDDTNIVIDPTILDRRRDDVREAPSDRRPPVRQQRDSFEVGR